MKIIPVRTINGRHRCLSACEAFVFQWPVSFSPLAFLSNIYFYMRITISGLFVPVGMMLSSGPNTKKLKTSTYLRSLKDPPPATSIPTQPDAPQVNPPFLQLEGGSFVGRRSVGGGPSRPSGLSACTLCDVSGGTTWTQRASHFPRLISATRSSITRCGSLAARRRSPGTADSKARLILSEVDTQPPRPRCVPEAHR